MSQLTLSKIELFHRARTTLIILLVSAGAVACGNSNNNNSNNNSNDNNGDSQTMLSFPTPALTEVSIGPESMPWLPTTRIDLAEQGYQQAEFFVAGTANSYTSTEELSSDGHWLVEAAEQADYNTRLIVYRPIDPADFNGTLIIEWLNVSGGTDAAPVWANLHTELIRKGYAWAGISAQKAGVEGGGFSTTGLDYSLKTVDIERYGELTHPGDSFSYDMFSQTAQALRHPLEVDPLGGLVIETAIAAGESQSAARMLTYVDAFGPFTDLYDGHYIQSRIGSGAPLSEDPQAEIPAPSVHLVRDDLNYPVMMIQTATDLLLGASEITSGTSYDSRQDDSPTFRLWEVAGTAHADLYSFEGSADKGNDPYYASVFEKLFPYPFLFDCPEPVNTGPKHLVAKAGIHALDQWIRNGFEPTEAARLEVAGSPPAIVLDEHGNTKGGVRTPYVDIPTATLGSIGAGDAILCTLLGTTDLFPTDKLISLYGDHASYVSAVSESANEAVSAGFLLAEDAELVNTAAESVEQFP
jgi:Alpha/beta hydrolase domain